MEQEIVQYLKQQQILLKEINSELKKKNSELESSKNNTRQTAQMLRSQSKNDKTQNHLTLLSVAVIPAMMFATMGIGTDLFEQEPVEPSTFNSKYLTENLRGDENETSKHWIKMTDASLSISIINLANLSEQKIQTIKETILSSKVHEIDDTLNHKMSKGTSNYYVGWQEALSSIQEETKYPIPKNFKIIGLGSDADITITLSPLQDSDGYAGITRSMTDGDQILKSKITIFNAKYLSDAGLSTIVRHEFGHAIGLGHSSAPEDLMYPTIESNYPYISDCNISSIIHLYDGNVDDKVICEK